MPVPVTIRSSARAFCCAHLRRWRYTCSMRIVSAIFLLVLLTLPVTADDELPPTTVPSKLPFIDVDIPNRRLKVACEAINAEGPLEFLAVVSGTNEHEAVLRTQARPSHIHLGLLMLGMQSGKPLRPSPEADAWLAPEGPLLQIEVEFERDGRTVRQPAWQMFRSLEDHQAMPPQRWIFVGSQVTGGRYGADLTGYVVSIVNFELSLIDVPQLASSSNELLEFELDPRNAPPKGAAVTLILSPVAGD